MLQSTSFVMIGISIMLALTTSPTVLAAYHFPTVTNGTPFAVMGTIKYWRWSCSDDEFAAIPNRGKYAINPNSVWTTSLTSEGNKGTCLIGQIKAIVYPKNESPVSCTSTSTETFHSNYDITYNEATKTCKVQAGTVGDERRGLLLSIEGSYNATIDDPPHSAIESEPTLKRNLRA